MELSLTTPSTTPQRRFPLLTVGVWLLLLVPPGLVLVTVLTYALNLPYWDDYLVQQQLLLLKSQPTNRLRLLHLFDQHWEHRIVWTRLVFAGWYKLSGLLNYYGLTLLGVSGLLVLFGLLVMVFRRATRLPWFYLLPVPFWLFTLQSHENLLWAMASIQNFWVLVFALGSFYALSYPTTPARLLALALAVLATYTSGNGALVLIAGGAVLSWQTVVRGGSWRFVLLWAVVSLLSIGGYFYGYQRITFFPSPFRYPYLDWVKAYFVFFGAFADPFPYSGAGAYGYQNPIGLTLLLGAALAALAVYLLATEGWAGWCFRSRRLASPKHQRVPLPPSSPQSVPTFFLATLLFLLATAAITVYSRVGFAGPAYLLQGRYKIYSALMLSVVYLYGLYRLSPAGARRLSPALMGLSLLTIGQSLLADYLCLEGIVNQHRRTTAEYFNYLANTPAPKQQAISLIFSPTDPTFYTGRTGWLTAKSWQTAPTTTSFDAFDSQPFMYWIEKTNAVNPTPYRPTEGNYIYLTSGEHVYLFPARPLRPAPIALGGLRAYFSPLGVRAQVLQEHLEPGQYRFGLLTNRAGKIQLAMTSQTVTFTSL